MKFFASDQYFLLNVLREVETKASSLKTGSELCSLAESLVMLSEALKPGDSKRGTHEEANEDNKQSSGSKDEKESPEPSATEAEMPDESSIPIDEATVEQELKHACDRLLQLIASKAIGMKHRLTAVELRRLLVIYSLLPYQADDLISHVDEEVDQRLCHLEGASSKSLERLLRISQSQSSAINRTLFEDPSTSRFAAIKNGLTSLFRSAEISEGVDEKSEENRLTEELAILIQNSVASSSEAAKQVEEWRRGSRTSLDSVLNGVDVGSSFELGRCQELIENYRRTEFSTGTVRSRYDKERRKDIAKRVLSRLLP
jgi:hypothetical protein